MSTNRHNLTFCQQIKIMQSDDSLFTATQNMLEDLINHALVKTGLSVTNSRIARRKLTKLIPVAAQLYLKNLSQNDLKYKFSTYFTWYIAQIINPLVDQEGGETVGQKEKMGRTGLRQKRRGQHQKSKRGLAPGQAGRPGSRITKRKKTK